MYHRSQQSEAENLPVLDPTGSRRRPPSLPAARLAPPLPRPTSSQIPACSNADPHPRCVAGPLLAIFGRAETWSSQTEISRLPITGRLPTLRIGLPPRGSKLLWTARELQEDSNLTVRNRCWVVRT